MIFSFHPALRLVADPLLFERFPQIAFNAGRLDRSIFTPCGGNQGRCPVS
jgi:prolyl-tRNA editing enzyme YbaK/EbsC (Cys-tRNA(Pro) deacylase)